MKVKLKKLHENAVLPNKATTGDFCYDVVAVSEEEIAPNVWRYKFGFSYEIDRENCRNLVFNSNSAARDKYYVPFDISIDLRPRSSIWKTGMVLSNSEGTLDEFYRGEAMAVFYHILPNMPRYKVGDKIGQIKLGITIPLNFSFVDEIDMNTERGEKGYGSSDEKK